MDRKYILTSLAYAILGMSLGIYMAATNNHGEMVAHAHIMLAGFVVSFIYGLCHKLWISGGRNALASTQFYVHQSGVAVMSGGLFLLYGNYIAHESLEKILAASSVAVLVGMILMTVLILRSHRSA
ncbi:MAG TPA: hypothetical protein VKB34_18805 [Povalibacter sp.]|nr:hypothetical protein [Povalibacter sp.]